MQPVTILDPMCASYLLASGVRLLRVLVNDTGRHSFEFDDSEGKASACLGEWRLYRASVNARAFADALKTIRRLMYTPSITTLTTTPTEVHADAHNYASAAR